MKSSFLLLVLFVSIPLFAQNAKIKELEQQRKDALREITNTDKLLKETKVTTVTLLDRIQLISNQLFSRQKVLNLLEQEINGLSSEEKQMEDDILTLEAELKGKQANYAKAIEGMLHNRKNEDKILFILSGKSITESYRRLRYLRDYSEWRKRQASEIKDHSKQLKERKEALAKAKTEKVVLLSQRETEQVGLKKEEGNYQQEVGEAQKKQNELQKILAQKKKKADALNRQIEKLIAEEVARQQREATRRSEEKAKLEAAAKTSKDTKKSSKKSSKSATATSTPKSTATIASATTISTPENTTLSNNFASNKGKLPYPITGNHIIATRFGSHQRSKWVTTDSGGIDIQSQPGAEAKAVFNGEVTYVAAIPGYNTCIIIRHGNYFTFYGNIQNIYIRQGDKVKTGQSLGKVYSDPDTGLSQIHFQLWQGTHKMNPEPWLRR